MDPQLTTILLALIAGLPGLIALIQGRAKANADALVTLEARRRARAETDILLANKAMEMADAADERAKAQDAKYASLEQRMGNLESELGKTRQELGQARDEVRVMHSANDRLRVTLERWQIGIQKLVEQIKGFNATPVWQPTKEDIEELG